MWVTVWAIPLAWAPIFMNLMWVPLFLPDVDRAHCPAYNNLQYITFPLILAAIGLIGSAVTIFALYGLIIAPALLLRIANFFSMPGLRRSGCVSLCIGLNMQLLTAVIFGCLGGILVA